MLHEVGLLEGIIKNLLALRIRRGIKRSHIAKEVGISEAYISMIENGKRVPSPIILDGILYVLGYRLELHEEDNTFRSGVEQ